MRTPISIALLLGAGAVFARAFFIMVTIRGDSMAPTLGPGDRVLAVRAWRRPRRDAIVLAKLPEVLRSRQGNSSTTGSPAEPPDPGRTRQSLMVKRLVALAGEQGPDGKVVPAGHIYLVGDGIGSFDSRQFGPVPEHLVIGVVVKRLGTAGP